MTYIVMEKVEDEPCANYLKAHPDETETIMESVAKAVRHTWSLPLPPNTALGPIGKQVPVDRFFSDYGAGRTFDNVVELENWINDIYSLRQKKTAVSVSNRKSSRFATWISPNLIS